MKSIGNFVAKHTPKSTKPVRSSAPKAHTTTSLNEAKLNNADDLARLTKKDADANTKVGKVTGFLTGKNKDRYKRSIDSVNQQKKDLGSAEKELNNAHAKARKAKVGKGLAYGVGAAGAVTGAGAAVIAHKEKQETQRTQASINKTITRFNRKQKSLKKTAELMDKEAGNALQKFLLKKWQKGDVDGATKAMKRVSEHTRKSGQVKATTETLERQSHGLAYMGEKGGRNNKNFAKTNTDGKVARKLTQSKSKNVRYIDKNGKKVNISEQAAKKADSIKPGIIKSQNTGQKRFNKTQNQVSTEARMKIPKNTFKPANNTSHNINAKQN